MEAKSFELKFMGESISVRTKADPELVQEAFDLATQKLAEAETRAKGAAAHKIALVALLDICEAYVRAKKCSVEQKHVFTQKTTELMGILSEQTMVQ